MVMETPTPQCVGREFVRQYYTMLHEAPQYLHRFYSQNSSFVHGGVEKPGEEQPPVMGQSEIHKKVMSLNFRDCHAKIRQVDSQATVGSAVVIQVTGELSNNGQPMRRFMQTFVLAPQSPKKYYVHNDIFRYQDEVFSDSDEEKDEEELIDSETEILETASQPDEVQEMPISSYEQQVNPPIMSNGTSHLIDGPVDTSQSDIDPEPITISTAGAPCVEDVVPVVPVEPEVDEEPEEEKQREEEPPTVIIGKEEELETEPLSEQDMQEAPKTFSWAAMASKTPSAGGSSAPITVPAVSNKPVPAAPSKPAAVAASEVVKTTEETNNAPQPQRPPRSARERSGAIRERGSQGGSVGRGESGEIDESRKQRWPDHHQLFVGNLPLDTTVEELRTYFEDFGKVVDVRINTKGTDKKHYGFISFEQARLVNEILKNRKDLKKFRKDYPRLNVEEKKPRSDLGRPGSGLRPNMRGGSMGLGRGGGMRGGMRGGMSIGGNPRADTRGGRGGPPGTGGGFNGPPRR
ncbi:ras GTPase-activating protein-binding protein 2-like [Tubulanus polymorphus]|uniref:ras GTPase-activating protein-binding protein 2-like n=1 Tax=Tubulanus polymorphus TaxID=672921 RepID=UPI003DA6B66E